MKKKIKNKKRGIQESLDFIIKRVATKDDVREIAREVVEEALKPVIKTQVEHTKILTDHTGQLNQLQSDMNIMRDKRMKLEVRSDAIEKHLHLKPPVGAI